MAPKRRSPSSLSSNPRLSNNIAGGSKRSRADPDNTNNNENVVNNDCSHLETFDIAPAFGDGWSSRSNSSNSNNSGGARRSSRSRLFGDGSTSRKSAIASPGQHSSASKKQPSRRGTSLSFHSPKPPVASSLFGSVMQNVKKGQAPPLTPKKNEAQGKGILSMLNSMSPFFSPGPTPASSSMKSPATNGDATPRHEIEWHPANVVLGRVNIVDWTLRSSISWQTSWDDDDSKSSLFTAPVVAVPFAQDSVSPISRWSSALLYWQYRNTPVSGRGREWQQAFSSLCNIWLQKQDAEKGFFYSLSQRHTVLFRWRQSRTAGADSDACSEPEIVVSASSRATRDLVRAKGGVWNLLGSEEVFLEPNDSSSSTTEVKKALLAAVDRSSVSKSEVAALREQAHIQGAAADVEFASPKKPRKKKASVVRLPLRLTGRVACRAFCDFYRGTWGSLHTGPTSNSTAEVPVLVCRSLGPFLHASLKSLDVDSVKRSVSGIILPCATGELVGAMIGHAKTNAGDKTGMSNNGTSSRKESTAPSSFAIAELSLLEKEHNRRSGSVSSSRYFNNVSSGTVDGASCCHDQERVQTIVWDMQRPDDVAYKVEYMM